MKMRACLARSEQCASAVGTVPSVGAGTRLRLRARCSGSNTGGHSPWGPATRKSRPGVESPTAHIELSRCLLILIEKHKMLPVLPGHIHIHLYLLFLSFWRGHGGSWCVHGKNWGTSALWPAQGAGAMCFLPSVLPLSLRSCTFDAV